MKKFLFLLPLTILLTGCLATPVKRNFPEVPADLKIVCPDLKTVEEKTEQLSKVLTIVTENYSQYHECKLKVDMWILWYNKQKEIFDSVK